jgi:hypothetical protein
VLTLVRQLLYLAHTFHRRITMTMPLATISADLLFAVTGGDYTPPAGFFNRSDFQSGGRNVAESAAIGGGAALGNVIGGPGGAFAGAMTGQIINRTGVPGNFGDWAGGKVYDAISSPPQLDTSGGPLP